MTDVLADLESLISGMTPVQMAEFDKVLAPELSAPWLPNPGPQTDAYHSKADLLLYGGAAGGGKSDLLLGLALTVHRLSVIFRRAYVDIRGLENRLIEVYGRTGWNGADKIMRRDDKILEFGALEKPGSEFGWQGRPHDLIGFDEGGQLSRDKVRFVMGWLRSALPGQRCRVVIASNPPIGGEGDWLVEWFAPWLDPLFASPAKDGELRWAIIAKDDTTVWVDGPGYYICLGGQLHRPAKPEEIEAAEQERGDALKALSRSFIPARLNDNPYLKGSGYRAQIQAMPEPLRTQLLEGDFLAGKTDAERQVIPSAWIAEAQARWNETTRPKVRMLALGVDVAQGGPDHTVLAPLFGVWFDTLVRRPGVDTRNGPAVAGLVIETMRDNCQITMDLTGGWGISAKDHLNKLGIDVLGVVFSAGSAARTRDGKLGFYNERAEMYWRFREALDPKTGDKVALPPDRRLAAQLGAATWTLRGDRILIEAKEDIASPSRLGMSPDDADAVVLAWHKRGRAIFLQAQGDANRHPAFAPDHDPFA